MVSLLGGDNRGIRQKHEVNSQVRDQIGLKLFHIHVQRLSKRRDVVIEEITCSQTQNLLFAM